MRINTYHSNTSLHRNQVQEKLCFARLLFKNNKKNNNSSTLGFARNQLTEDAWLLGYRPLFITSKIYHRLSNRFFRLKYHANFDKKMHSAHDFFIFYAKQKIDLT